MYKVDVVPALVVEAVVLHMHDVRYTATVDLMLRVTS